MKAFVILVVAAVMIGGGSGGALIVARILGGDDAADAPATSFPTAPSRVSQASDVQPAPAPGGVAELDLSQLQELRDRVASGDVTEEEIANLRQQFQDLGGFGAQGARGGGFGTIDTIDGATVTLTTAQGPLSATVGDETVINVTSETDVDSLELGMQVSVIGERDDSGVFVARAVTVVPEDGGGLRSGQFLSRSRQFQGGQGGDRLAAGQRTRGGFGSDRALTGTVESIDDGAVAIETPQGPLVVTVGPDTVVRLTVQGDIADLEEGMTVVVGGQAAEDGTMVAASITVVPEGQGRHVPFDGGAFSRDGG